MNTFKYILGIVLGALISIIFYLIGTGDIFNKEIVLKINTIGLYIIYVYGLILSFFLLFIAFHWFKNKGTTEKANPLFEITMSGFLSTFLSSIFVLYHNNNDNNVFVYLSTIIIFSFIMLFIMLNNFLNEEKRES